jgi:hypothetical protein
LRFEIRHPSHREELSSESDFVVFGRDPSCDVVIRNPRCSRRHASIRAVPEGFHLLDLGSSNGVYVLGQRVDDAIIREGDTFSMGDVFVRVLPSDRSIPSGIPSSDATMAQTSFQRESPRRSVPPPRPMDASYSRAPMRPRALLAAGALGASSILVGASLIAGALSLRSQIGMMAVALPILGALSVIAGIGILGGFRWARSLHFTLFTIWTLSCLLTPCGIVGISYHLRGEESPELDSFFTVLIGIGTILAVLALALAGFLARIYVPAPLPI